MGIVGLLFFAAFICVAGEPVDEEKWVEQFLMSKAIAAVFGISGYALFKRWESQGLLPDLPDDEI